MNRLQIFRIPKELEVPIPHSEFTVSIHYPITEVFAPGTFNYEGREVKEAFVVAISGDGFGPHVSDMHQLITDIYDVGLLCEVTGYKSSQDIDGDEEVTLTAKVLCRVDFISISELDDTAWVEPHPRTDTLPISKNDKMASLYAGLRGILMSHKVLSNSDMTKALESEDIILITDLLANSLPIDLDTKVDYVIGDDNPRRAVQIAEELKKHIKRKDVVSLTHESKLRKKILKKLDDDSLESQLERLPLDEESKEKLEREIKRLGKLRADSAEAAALENYIRTVIRYPWGVKTRSDVNLKTFKDVLSETHYGLDEIKDHLLEYMTIDFLRGESTGTVLCFVGPPGTGKTSIAKQIAKASERKFIRFALGGVSEHAELRGFKRTYIASKPGRLIEEISRTGASDPLVLFDEVDKLDRTKGGVFNALLEILDPEQNNCFVDHYLEVPVDLSKVLFICTANYLEDIPGPLLDRLELIHFRDYKLGERRHITTQHIIPKCIKDYSLEAYEISFTNSANEKLASIQSVRDIERSVRKLLRKAAVKLVVYEAESITITDKEIEALDRKGFAKKKKKVGF